VDVVVVEKTKSGFVMKASTLRLAVVEVFLRVRLEDEFCC